MGEVDADDDARERWIVWHYRFDPTRRERRHVLVAAFDSAREMEARLHAEQKLLDGAKAEGRAEQQEWLSGARKGPGHAARAAAARQAWKEARGRA
jgi:hypothetical protein